MVRFVVAVLFDWNCRIKLSVRVSHVVPKSFCVVDFALSTRGIVAEACFELEAYSLRFIDNSLKMRLDEAMSAVADLTDDDPSVRLSTYKFLRIR